MNKYSHAVKLIGGITNKTGIGDKFTFDLEFVVDGNAPNVLPLPPGVPAAHAPRAPTIFDALEEQLGLRLEPVKVPREYIVIDHIERPGPNEFITHCFFITSSDQPHDFC